MKQKVTGYRLRIYYFDEDEKKVIVKSKEIGDYETLEKAKSVRDDMLKSGYEYKNFDYIYYPPHSIIKTKIVELHR